MSHYVELCPARIPRSQFIVKSHRGKLTASHIELRTPPGVSLTVSPSKERFLQTLNRLKDLGQDNPATIFFLVEEHIDQTPSQRVLIYTRAIHREDASEYIPSLAYVVKADYEARRLVTFSETIASIDIHRQHGRRKKSTVFFVLTGPIIMVYDNDQLPASVKIPGADTFMATASSWMNIATREQLADLEQRLALRRLELDAVEAFQLANRSEQPTAKVYSETLERLLDKEDVPIQLARQTIEMIKALC